MKRRLKKGEARVIRIGKDAMFEFFCEMIMENGCQYFDLHDLTRVSFSMQWHRDSNEFTCIVCNNEDAAAVNLDIISEQVELTTDTMFCNHRYKLIEL